MKIESGGQSPGFDSGHSDSGFSNANHLNGYDSSNNGEKSMGRVTPDSSPYNTGENMIELNYLLFNLLITLSIKLAN